MKPMVFTTGMLVNELASFCTMQAHLEIFYNKICIMNWDKNEDCGTFSSHKFLWEFSKFW